MSKKAIINVEPASIVEEETFNHLYSALREYQELKNKLEIAKAQVDSDSESALDVFAFEDTLRNTAVQLVYENDDERKVIEFPKYRETPVVNVTAWLQAVGVSEEAITELMEKGVLDALSVKLAPARKLDPKAVEAATEEVRTSFVTPKIVV